MLMSASSRPSSCSSSIRGGRGRWRICSSPVYRGSTAWPLRWCRWSNRLQTGAVDAAAARPARRHRPAAQPAAAASRPLPPPGSAAILRRDAHAGRRGSVLLLADCFTTYSEPFVGRVGRRVLRVRRATPGDLFCCGRTLISKGSAARPGAGAGRGAGPVPCRRRDTAARPGTELLLTLVDEWPELAARRRHPPHRRRAAGRRLARREQLHAPTAATCRWCRCPAAACGTDTATRRCCSAPRPRPAVLQRSPDAGAVCSTPAAAAWPGLVRLREGARPRQRPDRQAGADPAAGGRGSDGGGAGNVLPAPDSRPDRTHQLLHPLEVVAGQMPPG